MKVKVIIGVICFLAVGIFIANWIIGKKIAEIINVELRARIPKIDLPVIFAYSEIKVNPLLSSVKVNSIIIADEDKTSIINCDALVISITFRDALTLLKKKTINEVSSFQITLVNPSFEEFSTNSIVKFSKIKLNFDGHITQKMLEVIEDTIPKEKQSLELSFSNMEVELPEIYREFMLTPEFRQKVSRVKDANILLKYLPDSKEILIENMSISTPIITLDFSCRIEYIGDINSFNVNQFDFEADISIIPSNLKWGQPDETGIYSFTKLSSSIRANYYLKGGGIEDIIPEEGEFSFNIEGLEAEFSGKLKQDIEKELNELYGISLEDIEIKKFSTSVKMEHKYLVISDTELNTSLFKATFNAGFLIDEEDPNMSIINNAKLVLSEIQSDLELTIAKFEKEIQQSLPRIGNDIVLEFNGLLGNPNIKGLNLE